MAHDHEDRSWMELSHIDVAWQNGVAKFIEDTFEGTFPVQTAPCPCRGCRRMVYQNKEVVELHLNTRGFDPY